MKILLLTAMLSTGAVADDFCKSMYSLGEVVMQKRQDGVPMPDLMDIAEQSDESVTPIIKSAVAAAFDTPRFNGSEAKRRAISEFANSLMLACIRANG